MHPRPGVADEGEGERHGELRFGAAVLVHALAQALERPADLVAVRDAGAEANPGMATATGGNLSLVGGWVWWLVDGWIGLVEYGGWWWLVVEVVVVGGWWVGGVVGWGWVGVVGGWGDVVGWWVGGVGGVGGWVVGGWSGWWSEWWVKWWLVSGWWE